MSEVKGLAERFDWEIANEHIDRAEREGRSEGEGLWDYLETLGMRRPEATDNFLKKILEEDRKGDERIHYYLNQIREIARSAQQKHAQL